MSDTRKPYLVVSRISISSWLARFPTVDEVRPKVCPNCRRAKCVPEQPFVMRGHGIRSRQIRGPLEPGGPMRTVTVPARRYLCRCGATCLVVPMGVLPHRRYSAAAITTAFVLYGISRLSLARVRTEMTGRSPITNDTSQPLAGRCSITNDWPTVRRWCTAVRTGSLFRCVRPSPPRASNQFVAERVATTLAAKGPPWLRAWPMERRAVLAASMYDDGNGCVHWGLKPPTNFARSAASSQNSIDTTRDHRHADHDELPEGCDASSTCPLGPSSSPKHRRTPTPCCPVSPRQAVRRPGRPG